MRRRPVAKSGSRRKFNSRAGKTKAINLASPRRGGWRL